MLLGLLIFTKLMIQILFRVFEIIKSLYRFSIALETINTKFVVVYKLLKLKIYVFDIILGH